MGRTSPHSLLPSSEESCMTSAARVASSCDSAKIFPSSILMVFAKSSACSNIKSAVFRRILARSKAGIFAMILAPSSAPAMAFSISLLLAAGTVSIID